MPKLKIIKDSLGIIAVILVILAVIQQKQQFLDLLGVLSGFFTIGSLLDDDYKVAVLSLSVGLISYLSTFL
ncbi:hypothetical protein SBV1_gp31 [Sulfolobales Beppu virus 1]|nr:hypothetical protein SBV1_gp31 [Sulfolobales Beppu virus 1]